MRTEWKSAAAVVLGVLVSAVAWAGPPGPRLEGRAVLPVETLADGPPAGAFRLGGFFNPVTIPFRSQPVQGFSAIIDGREPGEYLAMPDNGFGSKTNSADFLLRAYFIKPDFKTARGGSGTVEVRDYIQLRDPDHLIGFPIVNEGAGEQDPARLLTGADLDPESVRRDRNGDLWFGDEFGPFIVHTDATGKLLDPPFPLPGVKSQSNPFLARPDDYTLGNSRGFEGMALSPNGKFLYPALERELRFEGDLQRRFIFEFSLEDRRYTGRSWQYRTELPGNMIADMAALDTHRLVVIERDGRDALFRKVYVVDLRRVDARGFLVKAEAVDLTAIPDPDLVSLPALHEGDRGLAGDPLRGDFFWVMSESVEAIHVLDGERLLIGCDNNIPNSGRNPNRADDSEFIVVRLPGLKSLR